MIHGAQFVVPLELSVCSSSEAGLSPLPDPRDAIESPAV